MQIDLRQSIELTNLRDKASRAYQARDWNGAVTWYSQALSLPDISPLERIELLNERAACFHDLGNTAAEAADLREQISLIEQEASDEVHPDDVGRENSRLFDENLTLRKEVENRSAELTVIKSAMEGLASRKDIGEIFELVGEKIKEITGAQVVVINSLDLVNEIIRWEYCYEKGVRMQVPPRPMTALNKYVHGLGKTFVRNENMAELLVQYNHSIPAGEAPKSVLVVPLYIRGVYEGMISLQDIDHENAFDESTIRLLETLASSMSVALENARLFEETKRLLHETSQRNAELAIINRIQQGLASKLNLEAIYDLIGDQMREIFDAQGIILYTYDPKTDFVHYSYVFEQGKRLYADPQPIAGFTRVVKETGQPVLINENLLERERELCAGEPPAGEMPKSGVMVPLFVAGEFFGVIGLEDMENENAFSESDVRLLTTLANSMSVALENARLFEEAKHLLNETNQRNTELATVNTVSQALASETGLDALIQLTGEQIRRTFNADIVYLALLDRETNIIHFPYKSGDDEFRDLKYGEGLTSKIIESGKPLLINEDINTFRARLGTTRIGRQAASYLGVPIIVGHQTIGVISVQNTREEGRFTENDVRLLGTIAANVGTAIRNASLFDEIKYQKHFFEMIIAHSPAAIILIDNQINVTGWNPAAERLFGYSQQEALGSNLDDLVASLPELHSEAAEISRISIQDKPFHIIAKRTRKDKSLVDVEVAGLPVVVDDRQTGYVVIYHDITDLQHARQEAVEANQAKSAFLANMSHELRTPLNAIVGFTRIVRRKGDGILPEKQLDNLDKVLVSADHLLNLINSILDIAKIESGKMEVQISNFKVKPLIEMVAMTSQPLIHPDQVTLMVLVEDDIPTCNSDQEKIKQILLNLVSNAAKFTEEGSITISASHRKDHLLVSVADTGIGIPLEAIEQVFEEFKQADSSTTRKYGGTGLGLTISQRMARLLGGDLTVISQEGKGSTFTLMLPLNFNSQAPLPVEYLPQQIISPQAPGQDRPLVLVIDNDPDAVSLLRESLEDGGYRVAAALNGDEGLQLAQNLRPVAITLDIMMPEKDGWQVLSSLKADPATQMVPVILATIVDKKAFGYHLGASDYLVKPLDEKAVLASLERLLQNPSSPRARRLLVVDDDPQVLDMVKQLLSNSDYQITGAEDGEHAMESVATQKPDVILLDLLMPRMDGFKVINALQSQPDLRHIPVIILTAKSLTDNEVKTLRASVSAILKKQGLQEELLLHQLAISQEGIR